MATNKLSKTEYYLMLRQILAIFQEKKMMKFVTNI